MPLSAEEIIDQIRHNPKLIIADDYEVSIQNCRSETVKYRNGEESRLCLEEQTWVGLRLMHRKRPGRSAAFFADPQSLAILVDDAFEAAKFASPDPWFRFPLWKQPKDSVKTPIGPWDHDSLYPRLTSPPELLEEVYEQWKIRTVLSRKSERFQLGHDKVVQALHFSTFSRFNGFPWGRREERAFSRGLREREDWLGDILNEGVRFERSSYSDSTVPSSCPVLISPSVAAGLIKRMAGWFSAEAVQFGRSPLAGFKGRSVFSKTLSLVDDGNITGGVQSAPFDLEGSLTQKTLLVDQGSVNDFLYDVYTATKENRISTGNLVRFPQRPIPTILPTNLFFLPGTQSLRDLMGSIDEGIYLNSVDSIEISKGSETRIRLEGSGWRISRGQLTQPLSQLCGELDLLEVMRRVTGVGNDLNFYGAFGSPSILFENLPLEPV